MCVGTCEGYVEEINTLLDVLVDTEDNHLELEMYSLSPSQTFALVSFKELFSISVIRGLLLNMLGILLIPIVFK